MTDALQDHMAQQETYELVRAIERRACELADMLLELEGKGSPKEDTRRLKKLAAAPLPEGYRAKRLGYYRNERPDYPKTDVEQAGLTIRLREADAAGIGRQRTGLRRAVPVLKRAEAILAPWDEWRRAVCDEAIAEARKRKELAEEEIERREAEREAGRHVTQADLADILERLGIDGSAPDGAPAA